ncbi:MAG TPA: dipeptidase PepE [Pyrinomonadaceae bacterium]|nr:dipeptidase PepE [Pyrinomonadaceae bacterium]
MVEIKGENPAKRLLLISNSTLYGSGFLDHAETEIRGFLNGVGRVLFVPFALHDQNDYAERARERFKRMGYDLDSIHEAPNKRQSIADAQAIFIGGGNTFRLLRALYDFDLLPVIKQRVEHGMIYMGSSAGSNVAGPTIRTTNDMPIVEPPSLRALGLVSFQINPHYLDPDPNSKHMGETREERILQFLEDNDTPVVGLREGAMVRVEHDRTVLKGSSGARIFRKGLPAIEVQPGTDLSDLL